MRAPRRSVTPSARFARSTSSARTESRPPRARSRRSCSRRSCASARLSPHVRGWSERIRVNGEEADFERAVARVRAPAERVGATQFEVLTSAALLEFAEAGVDAAVVGGLGGRHDATNVLTHPWSC